VEAAKARESAVAPDGLSRYSDLELICLAQRLPRESPLGKAACEALIGRYRFLVRACIRKYENSPEPQEELMQVGYVGLLRAIRNFDPEIGRNLVAYALPCISGEVKRHFRDNRWPVHVGRPAQELRLEMRQAITELTQRLAHVPNDRELAHHLQVSEAEVRNARRAELAFEPSSLDAPRSADLDAASLADRLGAEDPRLEYALDLQAVGTHMGELPDREQRLLLMRFYGNMTQREISGRLGISQMHVSRLLAHALGYLRQRILEPEAS
jgi:RNA polymerase sigma-B factor